MIKIEQPKKILTDLVAINSTSRTATDKISDYICGVLDRMERMDFKYNPHGEDPRFQNLIAKNRAARERDQQQVRYFALCGHLDTVTDGSSGWKTNPFTLTESDGKIFGLGSADMKGSIACMLAVAGYLEETAPHIPLALIFTHSEEIGLKGAKELVASESTRQQMQNLDIIIGEPTQLELCYAHKGFGSFQVEVRGRASHSSQPQNGLNSIYAAAQIMLEIEKLNTYWMGQPDSGFAYGSTINVTLINGGDILNRIPALTRLQGDIRLLPTRDAAQLEELLKMHRELLGQRGYQVEYKIETEDRPFFQNPNSHFINRLFQVLGKKPVTLGYATDAAAFNGIASLSCAIIGPGNISNCHQPNEYITEQELVQGVQTYLKILLSTR